MFNRVINTPPLSFNFQSEWAIPKKSKQGVKNMEFSELLKKEHVEIPGVS